MDEAIRRGAAGNSLVTVSQEARYDGAFGKQCNRRNHGSIGGGAQCHENRSDRRATKRAGYGAVGSDPGTTPQKRQMDGTRDIAAKRRLKRALANGLAAQNEKGARIMRTPSPKHELNAIQQRSLQPQQQQLLQQPLPLRLLQQQQQPQPLQQP